MSETKQPEVNPWRYYFYMAVGVLIITRELMGDWNLMTYLDLFKMALGAFMIGYGIVKLKKKEN